MDDGFIRKVERDMKTSHLVFGIAGLAVLSLAVVALATAPVQACGSCGCGKDVKAPANPPTTQPADGKVVNARCPIMGSKLDREKVPASLTRTYKGQKVGFCCGGCPKKWDALTDEQRDAKLKAAME